MDMDLSKWFESIYEHASLCKSFALLDGVVSTQVKLNKLCGGLKPVMLYDIRGFVFENRDEDDFDRYDYKLTSIGDKLGGKLKINYLPQPYGIFMKETKEQDAVVDVQMNCMYKQFLLTGVSREVSVWAQFVDRREFLSADGCKVVPGCAFATMCLCLGMRHKICPLSIYEMICELWPEEGKRCGRDIKTILNERFLAPVVREMAHGEVDVLKIWGDEAVEKVEEIAKKGEKLVSMMNGRCIDVVEME